MRRSLHELYRQAAELSVASAIVGELRYFAGGYARVLVAHRRLEYWCRAVQRCLRKV